MDNRLVLTFGSTYQHLTALHTATCVSWFLLFKITPFHAVQMQSGLVQFRPLFLLSLLGL